MKKLFLLFVVVSQFLLSQAYPPVVSTIQSPDGDVIDCIRIRDQPSFQEPLLRDHQLRETPTEFPNLGIGNMPEWQVWHSNGAVCPENTIPIRNFNASRDRIKGPESPDDGSRVTHGHEYATISTSGNTTTKYYGTKVTTNVWQPKIENKREFSLGQTWVVSGDYDSGDLNSIEVGWQVFPDLYLDDQPRFFTFWTRDAYTNAWCYNMRCGGFIQLSRKILIEGAISPASSFGGRQTDLTIQIWKDSELRVWWLGIGLGSGQVFEIVGYWPNEIFTGLAEYATQIRWGGEIVNTNASGRHTTTQMGSGYLPGSGSRKTAYMRDFLVAVNETTFQPVPELGEIVTNPTHYQVMCTSRTFFYYGGQDRAAAVHFSLDSLVLVLCIIFHCLLFV